MSLWRHRKRGVCQLNAASHRCTGEIKGWESQLKFAKSSGSLQPVGGARKRSRGKQGLQVVLADRSLHEQLLVGCVELDELDWDMVHQPNAVG